MPFQFKNRGAIKRGMRNKLRSAMTEAADAAAGAQFDHVTSGGVALRTSQGPGRTKTGWMAENITSTNTKISGTRYSVSWGWPTSVKNNPRSHARMTRENGYKSYFDLQEKGFIHYRSGELVEGMHSLEVGRTEYNRVFRQKWGSK